jgi:hypothetical protein
MVVRKADYRWERPDHHAEERYSERSVVNRLLFTFVRVKIKSLQSQDRIPYLDMQDSGQNRLRPPSSGLWLGLFDSLDPFQLGIRNAGTIVFDECHYGIHYTSRCDCTGTW